MILLGPVAVKTNFTHNRIKYRVATSLHCELVLKLKAHTIQNLSVFTLKVCGIHVRHVVPRTLVHENLH